MEIIGNSWEPKPLPPPIIKGTSSALTVSRLTPHLFPSGVMFLACLPPTLPKPTPPPHPTNQREREREEHVLRESAEQECSALNARPTTFVINHSAACWPTLTAKMPW